jgi:hypothetical protein
MDTGMDAKRQKMTEQEIEAAACEAMRSAIGGPDTDVGHARLRNIEAYNAEPVGVFAAPEVEDRSDFVATDVADTVNGMLPQIMQIFVASDDAVEFEGRGQPGAEVEAKLATAYVNHLFYVRNDGVAFVHDWFWDALVQKVGFAKVWIEEESEDAKQKYEGQSQEQLVMLMQDGWQLDGQPEQDESGTISFTVKKEARTKCVKMGVVAPHEMRVDVNARWDAEPAMIGQVFYRRRYEWEEDGYDVSDFAGTGTERFDEESAALLGETDDYTNGVPHESHELIKGSEVYIRLDADGDGVAEWLKVCLIDDKLARYADGSAAIEQTDGHPFVCICPNPRPHSFFGDCPADFAYQPQRIRTTTVRAIQDNMILSVNQRMYINTAADVNIDDVLDSRAGGVIRGRGPAGDAIQPIMQPSLGGPAYEFNEYIASWAENRTGYNRYSAGTDSNALNKTKGGMELLTAKADMRMGLTARHFAVGMRKIFAKMLKLAIQYQNQPEMVALGGQFVPINPGEFKNQLRTKINVGLGTGTKEQQSARILGLMQMMQGVGVPAGVVRPQHLAEAIRLYVEANEFRNPERFVDPEPTGMPPNPQAFQQMQQQVEQDMAKLREQLQQLSQENESLKADKSLDAAKLQLDARKLEVEEVKVGAELEMAQRDQQARFLQGAHEASKEGDEDAKVAELSQQVADLTAVVQQIVAALVPPQPESV